MNESFPSATRTPEHIEQGPGLSAKMTQTLTGILEKVKDNPTPTTLALLFTLASADKAAAQAYGTDEVEHFFDTVHPEYSVAEQIRTPSLSDAIRLSPNAEAFFTTIGEHYAGESSQEQVTFLRDLGGRLGTLYNYDLLASGEHVAMSNEDMFAALRSGAVTGICGNIHTFIAETAQAMGLESWVQSGHKGPAGDAVGHVFTGVMVDNEIAWIDYSDVTFTGTDNYQEALGAYEEKNSVPPFSEAITDSPESLVHSEAQERIDHMTGATPTREATNFVPDGLSFEISEETTSFTIKPGMMYVKYAEYTNPDPDQYNPLTEAEYLAVGLQGEVINQPHLTLAMQGEIGKLSLHSNHATLGEQEAEHLVAQLGYRGELSGVTKTELGDITHVVHALGYAKGSITPEATGHESASGVENASGRSEHEVGYTAFFDPASNDNSFFVGASAEFAVAGNNLQDQDPELWHTGTTIHAGATIQGQHGVFSFEGSYTDGAEADTISLAGGFENQDLAHSFAIDHKTYDTDIPGHMPDETEVSYNLTQGGKSLTIGIVGEDGKAAEANILFSFNH